MSAETWFAIACVVLVAVGVGIWLWKYVKERPPQDKP